MLNAIAARWTNATALPDFTQASFDVGFLLGTISRLQKEMAELKADMACPKCGNELFFDEARCEHCGWIAL